MTTYHKSEFDIGEIVICDLCGDDYTFSDAKGGILFGSKACCPNCTPKIERDARHYGELHFIANRAKPDETFKAFVLRMRGGNNKVTVESWG